MRLLYETNFRELEMKKENLPEKTCGVCGKPMVWRKRWAKVWDEVKYCSTRSRRRKKLGNGYGSENKLELEA